MTKGWNKKTGIADHKSSLNLVSDGCVAWTALRPGDVCRLRSDGSLVLVIDRINHNNSPIDRPVLHIVSNVHPPSRFKRPNDAAAYVASAGFMLVSRAPQVDADTILLPEPMPTEGDALTAYLVAAVLNPIGV